MNRYVTQRIPLTVRRRLARTLIRAKPQVLHLCWTPDHVPAFRPITVTQSVFPRGLYQDLAKTPLLGCIRQGRYVNEYTSDSTDSSWTSDEGVSDFSALATYWALAYRRGGSGRTMLVVPLYERVWFFNSKNPKTMKATFPARIDSQIIPTAEARRGQID